MWLGKTRHIEIQHLWLKEAVRTGKPTVEKIPTETNSSEAPDERAIRHVDEVRELLQCARLWIRVQMGNLVRTGRG